MEARGMSRVFVTGGVGFIGSHLVRSLIDEGHQVIVADRRSPDESEILSGCSGFDFEQIELSDADRTHSLVTKVQPDLVYHLAAQPLSAQSNEDPLGTVRDNINSVYSVLDAIRHLTNRPRMVFTSSACFYGIPKSPPPLVEEDDPAVGNYVYTATKIAGDFAVRHYKYIFGLDAVVVRMVNVFGPGEWHVERVVPRLILQALRGEEPSLTQSDGRDVLSFLYVSDAVEALKCLATRAEASERDVWNIGGCEPISMIDLMRTIYQSAGCRERNGFARVGGRSGCPVHKYLDGSKIRERLGFTPSVDLLSGLDETIEWYRQTDLGGVAEAV